MFITQLSVFIENKFGRLSEVLDVLAENGINIRALSIAETSEFGILRMIVDDIEKAKQLLRESGVIVKSTQVIAAPLSDRPGGLAEIVNSLRDGGVTIEYLYAFLSRESDKAQVVLRVDDPQKACQILESRGK